MVSLVFFDILQLPHTIISNSEKLTHPNTVYIYICVYFSWTISALYTILPIHTKITSAACDLGSPNH